MKYMYPWNTFPSPASPFHGACKTNDLPCSSPRAWSYLFEMKPFYLLLFIRACRFPCWCRRSTEYLLSWTIILQEQNDSKDYFRFVRPLLEDCDQRVHNETNEVVKLKWLESLESYLLAYNLLYSNTSNYHVQRNEVSPCSTLQNVLDKR